MLNICHYKYSIKIEIQRCSPPTSLKISSPLMMERKLSLFPSSQCTTIPEEKRIDVAHLRTLESGETHNSPASNFDHGPNLKTTGKSRIYRYCRICWDLRTLSELSK